MCGATEGQGSWAAVSTVLGAGLLPSLLGKP